MDDLLVTSYGGRRQNKITATLKYIPKFQVFYSFWLCPANLLCFEVGRGFYMLENIGCNAYLFIRLRGRQSWK